MDSETRTLITAVVGSFAVTTTVIGILFRQLLKSYRDHDAQRFEVLRSEYTMQIEALRKSAQDTIEARRECELRENGALKRLEDGIEKIRDRWEQFVRDDAAMEATRGRKVDALFNVVDYVKEEVRGLKPVIFQRLDEGYRKIKTEVIQEIRADLRKGA